MPARFRPKRDRRLTTNNSYSGKTATLPLVERARVVRSAPNARSLFRDVRARAEALSEALVRFQDRKRLQR